MDTFYKTYNPNYYNINAYNQFVPIMTKKICYFKYKTRNNPC